MSAFISLQHFFAMGGYAPYVWPAYGIAAIVLGGNIVWARHMHHKKVVR